MDPRQEAAERLEQAINNKDAQLVPNLLNFIISNRLHVKISLAKFQCSSHMFWFPNEPSFFYDNPSSYHIPYICAYSHKICGNCLSHFTIKQFELSGLKNCYECPACVGYYYPNSILYDPELEQQWIASFVGEDAVNEDIIRRSRNANCNNLCNNASSQTYYVCLDNHIFCEVCIQRSIEESKFSLKCPNKSCKRIMLSWVVEQTCLSNKNLLKKIWENLKMEGFLFNLCPNCDEPIKTPTESAEIECTGCNKKFCIDCLEDSHLGISCHAAGEDQVKIVDLTAPANFSDPKTKLEREYLNAKFAFEQNAPDKVMVSAKMIINKALEMKYKAKREEIIKNLTYKDEKDVYVWHGSNAAAYDSIAKNGFGIGGVTPGVQIKTNNVFGYGVYTAMSPQLAFTYVVGDVILCCKAFRGNLGNNAQAQNPADLNNPAQNAYMRDSEGILVLFSTDQVIPVYLIQYRNA